MQVLSQDNFKVLIRVRPLNARQKQQISAYEQSHSKKMKGSTGKMIKLNPAIYSFYTKFYNCNIDEIIKIHKQTNTIAVADQQYKNTDRKMKPYTYSGVYDVDDRNKNIFTRDLKDHVSSVLEGYNCTILAYGITGSGKTYTIFGPTKPKYNSNQKSNTNLQSNFNTFNANAMAKNEQEIQGISYITFEYLLKEKNRLWTENQIKTTYKLSFIEIYNENVRDLLTGDKEKENKFLNVVEDYKGNTTIADVAQVTIQSIQQVYQCINVGNTKRAFASTIANQYSSRSHAILQLMVQTQKPNTEKTVSKLYIIDLAGSEKLQTLNCSKKLQQGANINRSLLALGNCINTLAQNSRKNIVTHIPYRDSKLTRLLKDSLGGNTKTIMIACISPNPFLIDQTMTTLNYAMRAQGIRKQIVRNQFEGEKEPKLQYLCLKCKKSSKMDDEFQDIFIHERSEADSRGKLKQRSSSLSNIPNLPISLQSTYRKHRDQQKFAQKLQILESLYEDIVNNIKESESIKSFATSYISNDPQWLKIKCINQEQRIRLKQILFDLFKKDKQIHIGTSSMQNSVHHVKNTKMHIHQSEKQNIDIGKEYDNKSLSSSKSRRRRSHNKFEIVKKSDSACKTIDFQ